MSPLSPVADRYFDISGYLIFWSLFTAAFFLFSRRMYILLKALSIGKEERRFSQIGDRVKTVLIEVLLGWCNLKRFNVRNLSELGHSFLVWGFALFIVKYVVFIGLGPSLDLFKTPLESKLVRIFLTMVDIAGLFLLIDLSWAVVKRFVIRPARLEETTRGILLPLLLSLMFALVALHYLMEGIEYALARNPVHFPPIGSAVARVLISVGTGGSTLAGVYSILWWANYAIILLFMVYAAYSKHLHPLFSPANIFFKTLGRNKGILTPSKLEETASFGATRIGDLTRIQLLNLYACTDCGRCEENCPAHLTGKPLSPWKLNKDLRHHLLSLHGKKGAESLELVPNVIDPEEIWSCTSCLACQEICPVLNEHLHTIVELRRSEVLEHARFPSELRKTLRNTEIYGDPLGMGKARRLDWARGLAVPQIEEGKKVDYLLFIGCGSAFFDRNQETVRILAQLLSDSGLSIGVLGKEEICCGDPIRRTGNESLFQDIARKNVSILQKYTFDHILTVCPHCFNTLNFEYPSFGGRYQVMHHSQLLSNLLQGGKLKLKDAVDRKVVFHDPCYLGRYNGIYDPPRKLIDAISGVERIEIARSKERSFCCGGGGGRFWMEEKLGRGINRVRLEEALEQKPEMIVTACPFCASMFDDALSLQAEDAQVKVVDILQLIKEAGGQVE